MTTAGARPILKAGCRLSPAGDLLLIPEGALRLQGPASQIVRACDGTKTIPEIISALQVEFASADPAKITHETESFIARLVERGVAEFV
jgi:hypothetical protein